VTERLIEMFHECIVENIPIYSQWQVTYDAISVRSDRRIFPFKSLEPNLIENIFQPTHFNSEQMLICQEMLQDLSLNGTLLQEDLNQFMKLCQTNIGPYGQLYHRQHCNSTHQQDSHSNTQQQRQGEVKTFDSLLFPKLWRLQSEDLSQSLNDVMNLPMDGTKEVHGIISQDKVMEIIQQYGKEKENLLLNWTGGI
jgi:hypothetical protein